MQLVRVLAGEIGSMSPELQQSGDEGAGADEAVEDVDALVGQALAGALAGRRQMSGG